jgi:hypothetical protein
MDTNRPPWLQLEWRKLFFLPLPASMAPDHFGMRGKAEIAKADILKG